MSTTMSKALQNAEKMFDKAHLQVPGPTRAFQDHETEISDRAEKTRRLRAARLEREQSEATFSRSAQKA